MMPSFERASRAVRPGERPGGGPGGTPGRAAVSLGRRLVVLRVGGVALAAQDISHVVRSLGYFGDAGGPLPASLTSEHWDKIQRDFEIWVRAFVQPETG